jgi:L-lactate utilization protein LutB
LDFDCIYIATGSGGDDFGLLQGWNSINMATSRDGVFLGGKLTGASDMQALKQGIIAAASMEKYLKVGSMTGQPESFLQSECLLPPGPRSTTPVSVTDDEGYSKEDAVAEAIRCIDCDCTACKDSCEFLKHMDMFPRKVETDAKMAAATQEGLMERVGTRMIASCSVCGHCGSVCPEGINVEDILIKSKRQLFEDGHFPSNKDTDEKTGCKLNRTSGQRPASTLLWYGGTYLPC